MSTKREITSGKSFTLHIQSYFYSKIWQYNKFSSILIVWLDLSSFSTLLVIWGCPCHIVLKQGVPILPLFMWSVSLISKDMDSKSLLGFGQCSNPWPPSPKAKTLAQEPPGLVSWLKRIYIISIQYFLHVLASNFKKKNWANQHRPINLKYNFQIICMYYQWYWTQTKLL